MQDSDHVMNFPLRYQKTVQDPNGLTWLFRTNAVSYNESIGDVGLWRDGPTYQVNLGRLIMFYPALSRQFYTF